MIAPMAVDGDRARFLIRQRLYKGKFGPRKMREPLTDRYLRYSSHPMAPVPTSHGKPLAVPQQVSKAWPMGVSEDRVEGKHIVYNPTAAGRGFWTAKGIPAGGRTPK